MPFMLLKTLVHLTKHLTISAYFAEICILSASTRPWNKCTYLMKFDSRVFYVLSRRTPLEIPTHWSELTISVPNKTTKVKFLHALIT